MPTTYSYKKIKLKVFVCGNYDEGSNEKGVFKEKHRKRYDITYFNKIISERKLKHWERLLMVETLIRKSNHLLDGSVLKTQFGLTHNAGIRNTYHRVCDLMKDADLIIILLTNYGGSVFEHALSVALNYNKKTINFYEKGDTLTGMITHGTFIMTNVTSHEFEDDNDLKEMIKRCIDTYKKEIAIGKSIKQNKPLLNQFSWKSRIKRLF